MEFPVLIREWALFTRTVKVGGLLEKTDPGVPFGWIVWGEVDWYLAHLVCC